MINQWRLLFFSILLVFCGALHEDEAGKHDWYKEKIGAIEQAVFPAHPRLVKKRLFYVATAESTVAALNVQTGTVVWRKVLARGEAVTSIRLYDKVLLLLTGQQILHAWDAEEGTTLWTIYLESSSSDPIFFKGIVAAESRTAAALGIHVPHEEGATSNLHVFTFNVQDGSGLSERTIPLPNDVLDGLALSSTWMQQRLMDKLVQLTPSGLVVVNPVHGTAMIYHGMANETLDKVEYRHHLPSDFQPTLAVLPNSRHTCANILLQLSSSSALILRTTTAQPYVSHSIAMGPTDRLSVCEDSVEEGSEVMAFWVRLEVKSYAVQLSSLPASSEGVTVNVQLSSLAPTYLEHQVRGGLSSSGDLQMAVVNAFSAGAKRGYRVLMVTEDATVLLLRQKEVGWQHIEGLGSITDAQFVNLPKEHPHQPNSSTTVVQRMGQRLFLQVVNLRVQVQSFSRWVVDETLHRIQGQKPPQEEPEEDNVNVALAMTQDEFNFRKLILAFSNKACTLYAIHTTRGQLAWKHFIKDAVVTTLLQHKQQAFGVADLLKFAQQIQITIETGYSLDEKHGSSLWHDYLLVTSVSLMNGPSLGDPSATPAEEFTVIFKIEVQTGNMVDIQVYPHHMVHTTLLPFQFLTGTVSSTALLLVDRQMNTHLYPDMPAAWGALQLHAHRIYFHLLDTSTGRCTGYRLKPGGKSCQEAWRMSIDQQKGEKVVAVSSTTLDRRALMVHSTVKLFNNKTTSTATGPDYGFKYTNPNVFAIATAIPPLPQEEKGSKATSVPSLNLYLVDGVNGNVLSQSSHPNAVPPVALLHVENFLLYHYLNTKSMKYRLGVWQLFEDISETSAHSVSQGLLNTITGAQLPPRSAFLMPAPVITRNMYNYPTALNCLGTSVTTKGITTKLVLAGNPLGQVVGLPLPVLENSKTHFISYPTQSIVTYNKTVHHLRTLRTSPTSLESSSHFLAIGLDLFYTRVAPAKSYDLLGDDFSYWLLLTTTTALLISTVVAKGFAKRRSLALAWV